MSLPRLPSPFLTEEAIAVTSPRPFSAATVAASRRASDAAAFCMSSRQLDRLFGSEHVEIGDLRRGRASRRQLDEFRADQALGDDPRHRVGANQPAQALVDSENKLHGPARLTRRDDSLHDAGIDALNSDAMAGFEPADRLEPGSYVKRGLHPPLAAGDLVEAEAR